MHRLGDINGIVFIGVGAGGGRLFVATDAQAVAVEDLRKGRASQTQQCQAPDRPPTSGKSRLTGRGWVPRSPARTRADITEWYFVRGFQTKPSSPAGRQWRACPAQCRQMGGLVKMGEVTIRCRGPARGCVQERRRVYHWFGTMFVCLVRKYSER